MNANKIVDYVKRTPGNTNPAVIKSMVTGVEPEPVEVGSFELRSDYVLTLFYVYDEEGEMTDISKQFAKDTLHTIYFPKTDDYQAIISISAIDPTRITIDGIETYSQNQNGDLIWFTPEDEAQVLIDEGMVE